MPRLAKLATGVSKRGKSFVLRYKADGVTVRKSFGTIAEANDLAARVRLLRATGDHLPKSAKEAARAAEGRPGGNAAFPALLTELTAAYLNDQRQNVEREAATAPGTGYKHDGGKILSNLESRFKPVDIYFRGRAAESIQAFEIEDFLKSLHKSNGTMNRYKTTLSSVYEYAKKRKQVSHNPVRDVKRMKEILGVPRYMTAEEEDSLRAVIRGWIADTPETNPVRRLLLGEHLNELTIASQTGMRKGNQYALRWKDDINLELRLIILPNTKTGKPHVIPMTDSVAEALKDQQRIQSEISRLRGPASEQVRMRMDGRVFLIRENREWFALAKKEAGIRDLNWHQLSRHTAGSRLAMAGANQKTIQTVLGHATIVMSGRYTHLSPDHVQSVMQSALDSRRG